ncbi:MAG: hypothetical protein SGPRY_012856, partial [Prymnesium sp.]
GPLVLHRGPRNPLRSESSAHACKQQDGESASKEESRGRMVELAADDELGESSTATLTPTELAVYGFVGLSSLVLLLYVGAEVAFGGYIFTYSIRALNMSHPEEPTEVPGPQTACALPPPPGRLLNSSFWGWLSLGRLLAVPASTRLSPARMLALATLGSFLSALAFRYFSLPWIAASAFGLFMAPIFPSVITNAEQVVRRGMQP